MNDVKEINRLLSRYAFFDEAQMCHFWSSNLNRDLYMLVNYTRIEDGSLRDNLEEEALVLLRFGTTQKIVIENWFNGTIVSHSHEVNWGINEFSIVRFESADDILTFRIEWEGKRYIEINCLSFDVELFEKDALSLSE